MQIRTTRKKLEEFECKFEAFKSDSKYSNENSNNWIGIRSIQMQIPTIQKGLKAFKCKFKPFEEANHSKVIRSIRMQIRTTRKGLEAFECKL